jgi:hypothetical protein
VASVKVVRHRIIGKVVENDLAREEIILGHPDEPIARAAVMKGLLL